MRVFTTLALASLLLADLASGQGRPIDWPSYGGDAQRSGWEKSDLRITKDNIKDFQLVLKKKLEGQGGGAHSLTPPVIIGTLISYRGFKELALLAGSSDNLWAIDADLERIFWHRHLDTASQPTSQACAADATAIPALTPPMNFSVRRPRPAAAARPAPGAGPAPAAGRVGGTGFGVTRSLFAISSDGALRQVNSATGEDQFPPLLFLPPNAKATSLTLQDGILYTTTRPGCGGAPNGVWAINLNDPDPKPVSFVSDTGAIGGIGGFALGPEGTVYVQAGAGASGKLVALGPKDLKMNDYFDAPGAGSVTPVVFTWKGRELVVSSGKSGSLYLLDAKSLGGADHKTPLYRTPPATSPNHGVWGGLSSWEDGDGTRWVLAPVWGPVGSGLKDAATNGAAPNGAIVAFKVEERDGAPVLTPAWVSRDMASPEPPVVTSGVVFALSAGKFTSAGRPSGSTHATLYALDGATGKEMYSTGNQVSAPANLNGVSVVNGRVYFTTNDSTLYAFGIYLER